MSFLVKIYPLDLRRRELWSPLIPVFRLLTLPFAYLSILIKIHPNFLTIVSFLTLILSGAFALFANFFISSLLMILTLSLDVIDGEVARGTDKRTVLGLKMESLHADLTLLIYPSSLAVGIYNSGLISIWTLFFVIISAALYIRYRSTYSSSSVSDEPSGKSMMQLLILSQQKPNEKIRSVTFLGKVLFFSRMNLATQFGFPFIIAVIFSAIDVGIVVLPLQIMAASHLIFAFAVVIGGLVRPFDS